VPDYTDIVSVRGLLPSGTALDDETPPTVTQVDALILQTGQAVNSALKQVGSTTPITDDDLKGRVKLHQTKHVVYLVLAARGIESKDKYWENWGEEFWTDFLALLSTPELAAAAAPTDLPWSSTMDADPNDPTDSKNPSWTRDYVP
jgi:hypothetical protein